MKLKNILTSEAAESLFLKKSRKSTELLGWGFNSPLLTVMPHVCDRTWCMKTNGVNVPGRQHRQCLWIQPWRRDAVHPCWLSGGHLGSKHLALWQVVFWVSLLALHAISVCSTQSRAKQNGPESAETEAVNLAPVQCLIRTSKDEWNMPDGDTQETIALISRWAASAINAAAAARNTADTIESHDNVEIRLIHTSQQASIWLAPLLWFHSLCHKHKGVESSGRYQGQRVFVCIHMSHREIKKSKTDRAARQRANKIKISIIQGR